MRAAAELEQHLCEAHADEVSKDWLEQALGKLLSSGKDDENS